jgi:hypothetical protein
MPYEFIPYFQRIGEIVMTHYTHQWALGSVIGWGTTLQAGRWWVRFPMKSLDFSIYLILPAALWPLVSTQPLTELSARNLPAANGRPARKAGNLTGICEPII